MQLSLQRVFTVGVLFVTLFLGACASLQPDFAKPSVKLLSLKPLPSDNLEQRFAVKLRISNPNPMALKLVGMSYAISLNGHDVIDGVSNSVEPIPAYGEVVSDINVSINMFSGMRFLTGLMSNQSNNVNYEMKLNLDTGIPIIGRVSLTDGGVLPLQL